MNNSLTINPKNLSEHSPTSSKVKDHKDQLLYQKNVLVVSSTTVPP